MNCEVENTIERLRTEFAAKERQSKSKELLLKTRNKNYQRQVAENAMRRAGKNYKDFTMDFAGCLVPVVAFPIGKCKGPGESVVKASVKKDSIIDISASYNRIFESRNERRENKAEQEQLYELTDFESTKANKRYDNYRMARLITPNYGVTVKVKEEVRKGPSFNEDPLFESRAPSRLHRKRQKEVGRATVNHVESCDYALPVQTEHKPSSISSSLLVLEKARAGYRGMPGQLPARIGRNIKYRTEHRAEPKAPQVIVRKETLRKNMEYVEEYASTRVKTAASGHRSVPPKSKGRMAIASGHINYKVAAPLAGHGAFKFKY